MEGIFKWLIAALACYSVTEIGAQYLKSEHMVPESLDGTELQESPKEVSNNQRALMQLKQILNAQFAINSDLRSRVNKRNAYLQHMNQRVIIAKQNWTNTRNAVMKARQVLSQQKVKLEYSWLLMERCQSTKFREDKVRRLADRLADKQSDEFHPMVKKHFLLKYLRILESFEDQIVQETRAGMGLSKKRKTKKADTSNSADIV
ncbi:uncharacterized protein LOC119547881 [Drosophila subpulchrella]|uniref:uncharacterized protein LOC119547881 n=1 Tax=Drosophila subpulchrella TaxID=1486046 RepID=UPI0018A128B5|nr:uncharacterized protein LOC119547881 [Drosophila subpulchrella]